jgi:hypothetical protein
VRLRAIVFAAAILGIPLAIAVLILPIMWGYGGFNTDGHTTVLYMDPSGPAARAGLRLGDQIVQLRGMKNVAMWGGPVGTAIDLDVSRGARTVPIRVTFEHFSGTLAQQQVASKALNCASALIAFLIALLVLVRARDREAGTSAAAVLVAVGASGLAHGGAVVVGDALAATFLAFVAPPIAGGFLYWAALRFLSSYPPRATRLRGMWAALAPWALCISLIVALVTAAQVWFGGVPFFRLLNNGYPVVADVLICVALIETMVSSPLAYRAPVQWLGTSWLAAYLISAAIGFSRLTNVLPIAQSHYADTLRAAVTVLLAFGVAYPVLRHRLVDLNLFVSRATVFGIVSALIVGIFIGAEWLVGRIFERSFGIGEPGGLLPEAATMAVVLVLGISARSIHRYVEERVSRIFFRRRIAGLEDLRRLAREADAATEATPLMTYGCDAIRRAFAPSGSAWYLREDDRYVLCSSDGRVSAPSYAFNAAEALRLRRWHEPFEADEPGDANEHALYVPMTLRGELLGFLRCGAKPDRTPYVEDEIAALVLLAHHVGLAVAWLSRDESSESRPHRSHRTAALRS